MDHSGMAMLVITRGLKKIAMIQLYPAPSTTQQPSKPVLQNLGEFVDVLLALLLDRGATASISLAEAALGFDALWT